MIKEQLKQENERKLFEKLLLTTIRPEFNNGGVTEAVSIVLFNFFIAFSVVSAVSVFRVLVHAEENLYINFGRIRNFRFGREGKKVPIHVPVVKKIHPLEHAQLAFLDHSKTLVLVMSSN